LLSPGKFPKVALLFAGFLSALLVLIIVGIHSAARSLLLSDLVQVGVVAWAACCSFYVTRRSAGDLRYLWMLLSFSLFFAASAQSLESYCQNVSHLTAAGPWPSDIIFILWVAPAVLMLLPRPVESRGIQWEQLLDFAQMILIALTAYFYFFYVTSRWDAEGPQMVIKILRLQLIRDLLLGIGFLIRAATVGSRPVRTFFNWTASIFLLAGASELVSLLYRSPSPTRATWTDFLWCAPFLLVAAFAAWWNPEQEGSLPQEDSTRQIAVFGQVLPFCIPLLVLAMGSRIAQEQLTVAWGAVAASFVISATRLLLTNEKQRRIANDLRMTEEAHGQSAEMFATAFRSSPDAMSISLLPDGQYLAVNDSFLRLTCFSQEEVIGRTPTDLRLWVHEGQLAAVRARLLAGEEVSQEEFLFRTKKGETLTCLLSAAPIRVAGKSAVLGMVRDITAEKRSEKLLRASEEKFRTLVENMEIGVVMLGPKTEVQFANLAAQKFFGASIDQVLEKKSSELGPFAIREDGTEIPHSMHPGPRVIRTRQPIRNEVIGWRRPGSNEILWSLLTAVPQFNRDGSVARVIGSFADITEHRRTEDALRHLSTRLLQLQDEERRRLGRELHDSLAQSVLAVNLNLAQLTQSPVALDERSAHALSEARGILQEMSREIRTLSYLLHPPLLDELGLVSAIKEYAEGYSARSGIQLEVNLQPGFGRLPQEAETALFRIVQESLSNIQRHSGSPTAQIHLRGGSSSVTLEVTDRGHGMKETPGEPRDEAGTRLGVGILGMRERVAQLGGTLAIESTPSGTSVRATIPVQAEVKNASPNPGS
jgi:PAS domain S-box-containing protein